MSAQLRVADLHGRKPGAERRSRGARSAIAMAMAMGRNCGSAKKLGPRETEEKTNEAGL